MSDLINRHALLDRLQENLKTYVSVGIPQSAKPIIRMFVRTIKNLPSEETEIIRCKDCRWNDDCEIQYSAQSGDEFFCGYAERKDNGRINKQK